MPSCTVKRRLFLCASSLAAAGAAALWALSRPPAVLAARSPERAADGRFILRAAARAFDTSVSICALHDDPARARGALGRALRRITELDRQLVVQRPGSRVAGLNASGRLDRPGTHLLRLVEFAQALADASGGAFDPTVQPLWELYSACQRNAQAPSRSQICAARRRIDWRAIEAGPRRIQLAPGTSITLNGIVQGYAADLAFDSLGQDGVTDALIDAGEYGALGSNRYGEPWQVGIQHPRDPTALIGIVPMDGRFLATSGDYSTHFTDDFSLNHIFDPHTGVSPSSLSGVSVAARSGLLADALTKPMMVLDLRAAKGLLDRYPGAGAVWIDKSARIVATRNLSIEAAGPRATVAAD